MGKSKIKWGKFDLILLILGLIPIGGAFFFYDRLPEQMAVHFGVTGEPDGYQNKFSFLLLFSVLIVSCPILIKLLSLIDPKRENYEKFARAFDIIRAGVTILLAGLFGIVLLYNLGFAVNIQRFVLMGIGLLFLVLGNYMGQLRFNYFVGIRTPWTLEDVTVWRQTHRLSGPVWMVSGLLFIVAAFLPGVAAREVFVQTDILRGPPAGNNQPVILCRIDVGKGSMGFNLKRVDKWPFLCRNDNSSC